ncbi:RYamide receptor-like [Lingula anatina]|uniref:RYamide receptor-like n=1 Tax=Lingula anatina TaxID=7574 RepID=A0A1S3J6Z0_LINAN|nr:RYamide receptor-like [Lingula anatina]|eukprot:XP_013406182.1 RYamide receptor-like [Lingula anatina]
MEAEWKLQDDAMFGNRSSALYNGTSSSFNMEEFLKAIPGNPLDYGSQVALITIYTTSVLLAVVGNVITIVVLTCGNRSRGELKTFLVNLAVSDLGMALVCMPFTFSPVMLDKWIFGGFMCTFVNFNIYLMVAVSIYTNLAIGVDRYWAVMYPLRQRLTKTKAKIIVAIIWVLAAGLSSMQIALFRTYTNGRREVCRETFPEPQADFRLAYTVFIFTTTYVVPLVVLACSYYRVGRTLWERTTPGNADEFRDKMQMRSKRKVIKMLVTVVAVFAVCWLPLHLFYLVSDIKPDIFESFTASHGQIYYGVFFACHWLAMANSFANPFIYGFLNDTFRANLLYLCLRCKDRLFGNSSYSHYNRPKRTFTARPASFRSSQRSLSSTTRLSSVHIHSRATCSVKAAPRTVINGKHSTTPRITPSPEKENTVTGHCSNEKVSPEINPKAFVSILRGNGHCKGSKHRPNDWI